MNVTPYLKKVLMVWGAISLLGIAAFYVTAAFHVDDVAATARAVIAGGGGAVGEQISRNVPGVGRLTFRYLSDPEGNIVEVLNWA